MNLKHKWNKLKPWQKGGVIGFLGGIIILPISMLTDKELIPFIFDLPSVIVTTIFDCGLSCIGTKAIVGVILFLFQLIILGALIGFIVGKVKGK